MTANTPQSRKAKGMKLQQWVANLIKELFGLHVDDVRSTSMGAGGEDVQMSPKCRKKCPFSIECKSVESFNLWSAYEQAQYHAKGTENEPIVVYKKSHKRPLVIVDAEYFLNMQWEIDNSVWASGQNN